MRRPLLACERPALRERARLVAHPELQNGPGAGGPLEAAVALLGRWPLHIGPAPIGSIPNSLVLNETGRGRDSLNLLLRLPLHTEGSVAWSAWSKDAIGANVGEAPLCPDSRSASGAVLVANRGPHW